MSRPSTKTPEQKAAEMREARIKVTRNRCLSSFSFGGCRTLHSQLRNIGYTDDYIKQLYPVDRPVVVQEIKDKFDEWFMRLEQAYNPPKPVEPIVIIPPREELNIPVTQETDDAAEEERNWLPPSKRMKCTLFGFQERAAKQIVDKLIEQKFSATCLRAAVGTGKTFIILRVILHLIEQKLIPPSLALYEILYVTKATIVEQTERVAQNLFGLDILHELHITNIEALRSKEFEWMIERKTVIKFGQEVEEIKWKRMHPAYVFCDESQGLKNEDSLQSKIFQALNEVTGVKQVFFSATPFLRPIDFKCFAVATRHNIAYGAGIVPLSNQNWTAWVKEVSAPSDPTEYCEAATKRIMTELAPYFVNVKGVRSQFNAKNGTRLVAFRSEEQREHYNKAWDNYLKRRAKIEKMEGLPGAGFLILAQFTIFRRAAEWCHAENFADMMAESERQGFAPVAAVSFKQTIIRIVKFLIMNHGYKRDDISIVWGGGQTGPSKKQELKMKFTKHMDILQAAGLSMDELGLDDIDDYQQEEVRPEWRLGIQTMDERQREIDRFQSGRTKFCLYTYKAGGVGLSLHHCDEMTKYKVRRKKSGWYDVDDIKNCPTRPRKTFCTPTYSAIELVQGLGRAPRLTSLSDTEQTIFFFAGTIEVRVNEITSQKLRCLRHVVKTKESWEGAIIGGVSEKQAAEYEQDDGDDEEGGMFMSGDDEEE